MLLQGLEADEFYLDLECTCKVNEILDTYVAFIVIKFGKRSWKLPIRMDIGILRIIY